jgi:hypothetical protein
MRYRPNTVWIDPSALTIEVRVGRDLARRALPDAGAALAHLVDAGCRVVMVGPGVDAASPRTGGAGEDIATIERRATLPDDATGWLVTGDPDRCGDARGRRVRTVLVGPADMARNLAHRVADVHARGLLDAVLVVLAADAMTPDAVEAFA